MADISSRVATSALAGVAVGGQRLGRRGGTAGVTLREVTGLGIVSVAARRGQAEILAQRIEAGLGLTLPEQGRAVRHGNATVLWSAPGQWLIQFREGRARVAALAQDLQGIASLTDQSDGRVVIEVAGVDAREALAKGVMVDLHPRAFQAGATAVTLAGHIGMQVTRLDEEPQFQLMVSRSFVLSLWDWLIASASAYGVSVVSLQSAQN